MFYRIWSKSNDSDPIVAHRWSICKFYSLAFAIAAFPILFLIDQAVSWDTSPILPGLLVIIVIWIFAPLLAFETLRRIKPNPDLNQVAMARHKNASRMAIAVALAWFILWLAVGA